MLYKLISRFNVEEERLDYNDYRYSIEKIIDITLRALSPGINDPNTAIHCINILGVILGKLGEIEGKYTIFKNKKSDFKIIYKEFNFKEELFFTFNQIVHYGKSDISVMIAVFNALNTINISSSEDKNDTISEFAEYVYENAISSSSHSFDKQMLNKAKSKI